MTLNSDKLLIYLITKGEASVENFERSSDDILKIVDVAVEEKIPWLQLREKQLPSRLLFDLTVRAMGIARGTATRILVNDRADIALAAKADGVHLAGGSLSTRTVRDNFPRDFLVGVSTHSLDEVKTAALAGADFAVFGPVFETPGKGEPQGLDKLSSICKSVKPFPVLGLGGIDDANCRDVLQSGAAGFAAIRFLNDLAKLRTVASELRK